VRERDSGTVESWAREKTGTWARRRLRGASAKKPQAVEGRDDMRARAISGERCGRVDRSVRTERTRRRRGSDRPIAELGRGARDGPSASERRRRGRVGRSVRTDRSWRLFGPTDRGRRARGWAGRATAAQAGAEEKRRAGWEKIERREGEKGFGPERIQLRN